MEHFFQNIPGWFDFQDVYKLAVGEAKNGSKLVEVGAWNGTSTAFMAVEIVNSGKNIEFYVVDDWSGIMLDGVLLKADYNKFWENMVSGGVDKIVGPIQSPSIQAASAFVDGDLDFVFIDGAHDYESVFGDISAWLPKVKAGGILAGHDIGFEGVSRAIRSIGLEMSPIGANSWLHRKKS